MAINYTGSMGNRGAVSQLPSCSRFFSSFYCVLFIELTLVNSEKRGVFGMHSVLKNSATMQTYRSNKFGLVLSLKERKGQRWWRETICLPIWCIDVATNTSYPVPQGLFWHLWTAETFTHILHCCFLHCEVWSFHGSTPDPLIPCRANYVRRELILLDVFCSFIRAL